MSSKSSPKGQYTTLRIAPSIYQAVKRLALEAAELTGNRAWCASTFLNVCLLDWIEKFPGLNVKKLNALYEEYENLKAGKGNLK